MKTSRKRHGSATGQRTRGASTAAGEGAPSMKRARAGLALHEPRPRTWFAPWMVHRWFNLSRTTKRNREVEESGKNLPRRAGAVGPIRRHEKIAQDPGLGGRRV